jgi:hypothetical protein
LVGLSRGYFDFRFSIFDFRFSIFDFRFSIEEEKRRAWRLSLSSIHDPRSTICHRATHPVTSRRAFLAGAAGVAFAGGDEAEGGVKGGIAAMCGIALHCISKVYQQPSKLAFRSPAFEAESGEPELGNPDLFSGFFCVFQPRLQGVHLPAGEVRTRGEELPAAEEVTGTVNDVVVAKLFHGTGKGDEAGRGKP